MGETGVKDAVVNGLFDHQTKRGNNVKIVNTENSYKHFYRTRCCRYQSTHSSVTINDYTKRRSSATLFPSSLVPLLSIVLDQTRKLGGRSVGLWPAPSLLLTPSPPYLPHPCLHLHSHPCPCSYPPLQWHHTQRLRGVRKDMTALHHCSGRIP